MRNRDFQKLGVIVLAAVLVRALSLWFGRAEFIGWFNHSYYYFVEVRGLLEEGSLPYPDMPLLFYLDALVARLFGVLGMSHEAAIVAATRAVMCVVPALVPLPIYGILKNMGGADSLTRNQWMLVLASGFMPLSVSHLPESMQKNMLGFLLLAALILVSQKLLQRTSGRDLLLAGALIVAIVLTHFGTLAAMVFWGVALLVAWGVVHRSVSRVLLPAVALSLAGGLVVAAVRVIDAQRFARIVEYASDSASGSMIGALVAGTGRPGLGGSLGAVFAFYVLFAVLYLAWARFSRDLPGADRVFWLANIAFCGLLVLPIMDERLMSRMVIFLSLPLVILLAHLERYCLRRPWARSAVAAAALLGVMVLSVGEVVSSRVRERNNAAVLADLMELKALGLLGPEDLVVTKTGAEHVSNWFYDIDAGVITSLSLDDFDRYETVWVLNPIEGALNFEGIGDRVAETEEDRYLFMRRNIPRPTAAELAFQSDHVELFELEGPPAEWVFDEDGEWYSY